jgi:hypothetical protein
VSLRYSGKLSRLLDILRRRPLLVFLPLQALLLLSRIDLLAPWGDEIFTLEVSALPLGRMLERLNADIHPPLYFLLQSLWQPAAPGWTDLEQARLLSALFTLAATVALDRFFLRSLSPEARVWGLALWCLSPCVLLYGRMARSYSLQTLLSLLVFAAAGECRAAPSRVKPWALLAAALAALLYTHYVPGLALLAAAVVYLLPAKRPAALTLSVGAALALYLPWLASLASAVSRWGGKTTYALSGSAGLEHFLKLGYWFVSFNAGETFWGWLLFAGLMLAFPAAALALAGARSRPAWLLSWMLAAVIGYIGVAGWVAYPFIPARLLWLLPLYLTLLATGIAARPAWGRAMGAALLVIYATGDAAYFFHGSFLNKGYSAPYDEIAARIQAERSPGSVLLLADCCNADLPALLWQLNPAPAVESVGDEAALAALLSRIDAAPYAQIWFFRNGHDVTAGHINERLDKELNKRYPAERRRYLPYSPAEQALMKLAGVDAPPESFYVLTRFGAAVKSNGGL